MWLKEWVWYLVTSGRAASTLSQDKLVILIISSFSNLNSREWCKNLERQDIESVVSELDKR